MIMWSVVADEDGVHIVPLDGAGHITRIYCWCRPIADEDDKNIWVHHCDEDVADEHRRSS